MSSGIWKRGEEPPNLFEKGTRVRFLKSIQVGDGQFGGLVALKILAGATGTIMRVFPDVRVAIDAGEANPYDIQQIEVHRSALKGGMVPLRSDGKADLKLVT